VVRRQPFHPFIGVPDIAKSTSRPLLVFVVSETSAILPSEIKRAKSSFEGVVPFKREFVQPPSRGNKGKSGNRLTVYVGFVVASLPVSQYSFLYINC
jgi:hypothetical protein